MTQLEHARRSARAIRLGQRARIAERGGLRFRAVVLLLAAKVATWRAARSWRALNGGAA